LKKKLIHFLFINPLVVTNEKIYKVKSLPKSIDKMKFCKKLWLKYQIKRYNDILLKAGMEEAHRKGKNLRFGLEGKAIVNNDIFNTIYLPENEKGIDTSQILSLGAEVYPEEGRKYLVYSRMLDRLER
tara:strand:+ start:2884 stop:3267 length:384 start_codon:yes stop_codon:yes gene_type:complete